MIDEKKCYFFGRNKQLCDFCIDHASSSRVHAALVWHKHLNRPFIIDLGSSMRLPTLVTYLYAACSKSMFIVHQHTDIDTGFLSIQGIHPSVHPSIPCWYSIKMIILVTKLFSHLIGLS